MSLLRTREWRALLEAVHRLHCPVTQAQFPAHLFDILSELLPGSLATFDFVDLKTGKIESHVTPAAATTMPTAELEAVIREFLPQNPVVAHLTDVQPTAVIQPTDLVSQRQFRRTDLFQLAFRPLGVQFQIAAGLAWPGRVGGFAISRPGPRNFTAREVELVRRLQPHVERAFANTLRFAGQRTRSERKAGVPVTPLLLADGLRVRGLTRRELEVLHWVGEGKRNSDISAILGVAPRTVEKHVEHLFAKLGVETRTAAVAAAYGAGSPTG